MPQAEAEPERFDIDRYAMEGNTLRGVEEISTLVAPVVGKQREYGEVQRALEALELCFRECGFSAVQKNFNWRFDFAQILDQGGTKVRGARKAQFAVYYGF